MILRQFYARLPKHVALLSRPPRPPKGGSNDSSFLRKWKGHSNNVEKAPPAPQRGEKSSSPFWGGRGVISTSLKDLTRHSKEGYVLCSPLWGVRGATGGVR